MQLLVLSLARSAHRRKNARAQLDRLGLAFEFLDGVDGQLAGHPLLARYDEDEFLLNCGRHALPGELGCYASHFLAWRACAESDQPILVVEDDFEYREAFPRALATCESLIERFGFIRLEHSRRGRGYTAWKEDEFRLIKYLKMPQGGLCYALTPRVARAFIQHSQSFSYPVDVFIRKSWLHGQALFGLLPYTVFHGNLSGESLIGDRGARPERTALTRLKRTGRKFHSLLRTGLTNLQQSFRRY